LRICKLPKRNEMTFWLSSQSRKRWEEKGNHETYKCTLVYVFNFIGRMRPLPFSAFSRDICALKSKQITYTCTLKIIEISDCDSMITFPNISREPPRPQIPWTNTWGEEARYRYGIRPKDTDTHAPRIRRLQTPTQRAKPLLSGFFGQATSVDASAFLFPILYTGKN